MVEAPSVAVVVPFYGDDTARLRNMHLIREFYSERPAGWTFHVVGGESLSAARNAGAAASQGDVLVFNDADTLVAPLQLAQAVRWAADQPGPVFAFTVYLRLSQAATEALTHWKQALEAPVAQELYQPPSNGCMAISRASFEQAGGYDKGFVGWGFEDMDFTERTLALWGPPRRVEGEAVHLWHGDRRDDDSPVDEDEAVVQANWARLERNRHERSREAARAV